MWAHRRGPALGPGALHCPRPRSTRAFVPGTGCRRTAELGRGTHSAHGRPGASQGEGHQRQGFEGRRELMSQAASLTASGAPGRLLPARRGACRAGATVSSLVIWFLAV